MYYDQSYKLQKKHNNEGILVKHGYKIESKKQKEKDFLIGFLFCKT